jgi:hypothetical protein
VHEARFEQDPEVLGDGLSRDVEALGDLAGGALVLCDEPEHLAPAGFGEHLEGISHDESQYLRECLRANLRRVSVGSPAERRWPWTSSPRS